MPTTYYPFGQTLADVALTAYGRSIIVDPYAKVRFFADQAMTTELVDIRGSDGLTALAPGTLATLKSGALPLFYLAVTEAWIISVGAPADALPQLIECHQSALLGGALGATDQTARTAAATAQTTANGAVTGLAAKADLDASTGKLSLTQVPARYADVHKQYGIATLGRIDTHPVTYDTALALVVLSSSRPPMVASTVVTAKTRTHGNAAYNTPATLTLPVGSRRVYATLLDALAEGDETYTDVTSIGSGDPGADLTVQFLGVGARTPPTAMAQPSAPTGVTLTVNSGTQNTITWTAGAGGGPVTTYHVLATNGGVQSWLGDVEGGTLTFVHIYSTGTWSGYTVVASNPDLASTAAGTGAGFTDVLPQANGAISTTIGFASKGSAAPASNPNVASNRLRLTSGTTGGTSNNDKVMYQDIVAGDVGKYAGEVRGLMQLNNNTAYANYYVSCNAYDLGAGTQASTYLQLQLSLFGWRLGCRTTAGTFSTLATATWTTSLTALTDYGFRFIAATVAGDGSQLLTLLQGSSATYGSDGSGLTAGTATLNTSATVPAASRSAIPSGRMGIDQLGTLTGSTTVTEYSDYGKLRFIPGAA